MTVTTEWLAIIFLKKEGLSLILKGESQLDR